MVLLSLLLLRYISWLLFHPGLLPLCMLCLILHLGSLLLLFHLPLCNLILSSFAAKAKQLGITMTVDGKLPSLISLSDTELCSLLSNGLENAITAASERLDFIDRSVAIKITIHKGKLLISIENLYTGKLIMKDGVPLSAQEGHGYGTLSVVAIAEEHGGQAIFNAKSGVFTLKIMLPLEE